MKAKAFRPVTTTNALNLFRAGAGLEPIFAFSNCGAFDPATRQILFIGAPHGVSMRFVAYRESDNNWRTEPMPSGDWGGAHTYDHLTIDRDGIFYHLYWADGVAYRFNPKTNAWLSPLPKTNSGFGTFDYFPELNGLVRAVAGSVTLYDFSTQAWRTIGTGLAMSGLHSLASYSRVHKVLIFGGGDGSRDWHKLDASGKITTMKNAPFDIGISSGILACDPVTGDFLFLNRDSLYAFDLAGETWKGVVKNPYNAPDFTSHYVVGVTMDTLGVVAFLSTYTWPVLLYKHADKPAAIEKGFPRLNSAAQSAPSVVYNIRGRIVARLGAEMAWNKAGVPAGVYMAVSGSGRNVYLQKLVVVK